MSGTEAVEPTKPWEIRDQRLQERYELVATTIEDFLESIDFDTEARVYEMNGHDPETLAETPFVDLVDAVVEVGEADDIETISAGYDVVPDNQSPAVRQVGGLSRSEEKVVLGPHRGKADIPLNISTRHETAAGATAFVANELHRIGEKARYALRTGDDSLDYWESREFWPDPELVPAAELRDHLLEKIDPIKRDTLLEEFSYESPLTTDQELAEYLQSVQRWYPDRYTDDLPDEIAQPMKEYLEWRWTNVCLSPLEPHLVRELLNGRDVAHTVRCYDHQDAMLSTDVENEEDKEELAFELQEYGYELHDITEPTDSDMWVRTHWCRSRDHREVLGRLIGAGIDPETALHYWAGHLAYKRMHRTATSKRWAELTGARENEPNRAWNEILDTLEKTDTSYLEWSNPRPAPDVLSRL